MFLQNTEKVDFSYNPLADPKFAFYDHSLVEAVKLSDVPTHRFFRLLSLCHTVMPEEKKEGEWFCSPCTTTVCLLFTEAVTGPFGSPVIFCCMATHKLVFLELPHGSRKDQSL